MAGTTVKDVNAVFAGLTAGAAKGVKNTSAAPNAGGSFQSVWSNQMGKSAQASNKAQDTAKQDGSGEKSQKTDQTLKARDTANAGNRKNVSDKDARQEKLRESGKSESPEKLNAGDMEDAEEITELSPEQLEAAMEVLGAAAAELMQRIADVFGISTEELQAVMEELDLQPTQILQPSELGELLLTLGGAEEASALVTDEALYDSYRQLMEQRNGLVDEAGRQLEREFGAELKPQQMTAVIEKAGLHVQESGTLEEAVSDGFETTERYESFGESQPTVQSVPKESEAQPEGADQKDSGQKPDRNADGHVRTHAERAENPFAQDLRAIQPEQGLQQPQSVAQESPWTTDTQDIMRQIMDYMKVTLNAESTNLEMQLHPASLGTLQIQVQAKAGVITANFVTQNEAVKAALESQMVQLKESFEEQGVKVEAIEVTVQSHAFERNLDQGRGQGQSSGEPAKKARVRRINLNDASTMENMEEEDTLLADMMAAGGSTVDYTA